jgi:hypothetical protein
VGAPILNREAFVASPLFGGVCWQYLELRTALLVVLELNDEYGAPYTLKIQYWLEFRTGISWNHELSQHFKLKA